MLHDLLSAILVLGMLSFIGYMLWLSARHGTGTGGALSDWMGDAPYWHYNIFTLGLAGLFILAFATVVSRPGETRAICKLFPSYADCQASDD